MPNEQATHVTEEQVQGVAEKFKTWARTLPDDEQRTLAVVVSQVGQASGDEDTAGYFFNFWNYFQPQRLVTDNGSGLIQDGAGYFRGGTVWG